jgi:hypothetical protein
MFCVVFCVMLLACAMVHGHEREGDAELLDDAPHESSSERFTGSGACACTGSGACACTGSGASTTWHAIL